MWKERLGNPVWHIHNGNPPEAEVLHHPGEGNAHGTSISFGMLLNLAAVANSEDASVLWGFLRRYATGASPENHPKLDQLVGYAVAYFRDFVRLEKKYRLPDDVERNRFVVLDADGRGQTPATAANDETRIVFHLTNADPLVAAELLDEVEGMLAAYQADHRPLRVEVVSHSEGLDLLRESLSGHKERIHQLAVRFPNLAFVACKNTIDRLRVERGIEVKLIPDAEVIDSGVSHVVKRQKEGWSYIRV